MAKKKKKNKSADHTPSADEIIEALSLEMGVDVEKDKDGGDKTDTSGSKDEPAEDKKDDAKKADDVKADDAKKDETEEKSEDPPEAKKKKSSADDALASMGGIFDVPSSGGDKKQKKKKEESAPSKDADESKADGKKDDKDKPSSSKKKTKKSVDEVAGVVGVFDVTGSAPEVDLSEPVGAIDDDEIDRFERKTGGGTNKMMIGIIFLLVIALGGTVIWMGGYGDDILAVFSGTYRDQKDAEKRRIEEEHRKEQLEKLEKYGALNITGTQHALFKIQLDGATTPTPLFGRIGETNIYRPLRLPVTMHNLKIKKPINIIVEAPGFQPSPMTLTKDMWADTGLGDYQYQTSVYLNPASPAVSAEHADRMLPFEEEEEQFGTITVNSVPPGAKIKINKRLVIDKEGNPVLTPATITHVPVDPEKVVEPGKKKPEPAPLKINTPPDNGYRVDVFFDDPNMPIFLDVVQRSLWDCLPKSDDEIKKLPKDARPALLCKYAYTVTADFNAMKTEILRQQAAEEELRKQAEERKKIEEEAENAKKGK